MREITLHKPGDSLSATLLRIDPKTITRVESAKGEPDSKGTYLFLGTERITVDESENEVRKLIAAE